ncbi:hypothetical protein BDW22DRAFT_1488572 [Trametopsis cervina]|nr:hypothetical protein BDW22DRAFT_1488572 [Trametopsis cervina]
MDRLSNAEEDEKPLKKRKLDRLNSIYRYPRDTPTPSTHDSDSGTEQSPNVVAAGDQPSEPHPNRHPSLWFQDGLLIVIASDDLISALPSSTGSVYHEKTLQLPERGADLAEFFEVLYDGHSYYDHSSVIQFESLRRLLLLAIKYKVSHIINSGISRLEALYPSDYDNWTEWVHQEEPATGNVEIVCEDSVAVVEIARATGRTELLPVALYASLMVDWKDFLKGKEYGPDTVKLSAEDQILCLNAQDKLREISVRIGEILLGEALNGPGAHCQTRPECWKAYRELASTATRSSFTDIGCFCSSVGFIQGLEAKQTKKRCSKCVQYLTKKIEEREREEWQTLGDVFGIPDWPPELVASPES